MAEFRRVFFFSFFLIFLLSCSFPLNATSQSTYQKNQHGALQKTGDEKTDPAKTRFSAVVYQPDETGGDSGQPRIKKVEPAGDVQNRPSFRTNQGQDSQDVQEQQELLDQALDLLNQSRGFWQKGDIDNSLRCLDEAYALILEVNGEPEIARQKDDLRLIIAKRILEISSSRHTMTTGKQSEIPMIMNADVEREIRSFQTVERGFFIRSYQRSGFARQIILKHLKEAGLPKELSWLPLVESGFQINALSRARALGLWQFIPSTGYKYALQRDRWIDERLDIEKSTKAAIAYLKELHDIFGDWLTCLAAYNCGEGRVLRVISKQRISYLDHFWDLYRQLPNETARYVPRFLATLHIIKNPKKYGMDLGEELEKPIPYEMVRVEKCMRLQDIAQHLNISKEVMTTLNSELRLQTTPDREYFLKVPPGMAVKLASAVDNIPKWEPPKPPSRTRSAALVRHKVRKGESLKSIARRYKTNVQDIMEYNDLSSNKLRSGQILRVPARGYAKKKSAKGEQHASKSERHASESKVVIRYKVKQGDSIAAIARRYHTTTTEIRRLNSIKGSKITVDQMLLVKDGAQ